MVHVDQSRDALRYEHGTREMRAAAKNSMEPAAWSSGDDEDPDRALACVGADHRARFELLEGGGSAS